MITATLNATRYSPAIQNLLDDDRVPDLGPGHPNKKMKPLLAALRPETAFPRVKDLQMAQLCIAGLWLHHDFLEESHEISQLIKTPSGGYWHGIMHRREPDAWNAKYWFKQVGRHPVLRKVGESLRTVYDPFEFIDRSETFRDTGSPDEEECRQIQFREWEQLFEWCYEKAVNG